MGEATATDLLHQVWLAVHVRRFDKQDGTTAMPDCFYAGVLSAESAIRNVAVEHGVHPHTLRNMESPPSSQRHVVLVDTRSDEVVERVARAVFAEQSIPDSVWDEMPSWTHNLYRGCARAVLASLLTGETT